MEYNLQETILIGSAGSVLGGVISYLLREFLSDLLSWFLSVASPAKIVKGHWKTALGKRKIYREVVEIKQWGKRLHGEIICTDSADDPLDKGKVWRFRGEIRGNDVIGFYWLKSNRNADNGSFYLKHTDNNEMKGFSIIFNQTRSGENGSVGIETHPYEWEFYKK